VRKLSPLKAIKIHCLDCSGGMRKEVAKCLVTDCAMYPFRLGKNTNQRGIGRVKNAGSSVDDHDGMAPDHSETTETE